MRGERSCIDHPESKYLVTGTELMPGHDSNKQAFFLSGRGHKWEFDAIVATRWFSRRASGTWAVLGSNMQFRRILFAKSSRKITICLVPHLILHGLVAKMKGAFDNNPGDDLATFSTKPEVRKEGSGGRGRIWTPRSWGPGTKINFDFCNKSGNSAKSSITTTSNYHTR